MNYERFLLEQRKDICWIRVNRAKDRNSIDSLFMDELHNLLDQLEKTSTRAAVFTGEGQTHFIGGADGVEMMKLQPDASSSAQIRTTISLGSSVEYELDYGGVILTAVDTHPHFETILGEGSPVAVTFDPTTSYVLPYEERQAVS